MNVDVTLYEYDIIHGSFDVVNSDITADSDINNLFEFISKDINKLNKFFIVTTDVIGFGQSVFYTIRTDKDGNIMELEKIVPNNIDKDMLVDAIVGCKPSGAFLDSCKDRIIERCIENKYDEKHHLVYYEWSHDVKDRLKKMNALRLKEIYKKLKSLPY